MNLSRSLKTNLPSLYHSRVREISRYAASRGLRPYFVGGMVRDLLLGIPFQKDCDLAFAGGSIAELAERFARRWSLRRLSYPQFQTHTLLGENGFHLDLITARRETYSHPAALPEIRPGTLEDDLARRDFTVNAIALDAAPERWGELIDRHSGLSDLRAKTLRILHDASFEDDPTRIFRAARYAGRFGFKVAPKTLSRLAASVRKGRVRLLSGERVRHELEKLLAERDPSDALALLQRWKVLAQVSPALRFGVPERRRLSRAPASAPALERMALWFLGAEWTEVSSLVERLHFPKEARESILQPSGLMRDFLSGVSCPNVPAQSLHIGTERVLDAYFRAGGSRRFLRWVRELKRWAACKPILNGSDLRELGYAPGPLYREALDQIRRKKFAGALKTKKDEIRFLIDNFRRT